MRPHLTACQMFPCGFKWNLLVIYACLGLLFVGGQRPVEADRVASNTGVLDPYHITDIRPLRGTMAKCDDHNYAAFPTLTWPQAVP